MAALLLSNCQRWDITTELKKTLEKMIILSTPRLNNLIAMIIGIIASQSVVLSKISQELKDSYSTGTEESKIKIKSRKKSYSYLV